MGCYMVYISLQYHQGKKGIVGESRLEPAFHITKNSLPNLSAWELWPHCGASLFNMCFVVCVV